MPFPNDLLTTGLTAVGLLVFFYLLTFRRKPPPDHEHHVRRSVQRLFQYAARPDYPAAASFLAGDTGEVLRYSGQPGEVEARCRALQELAAQGGVSVDKVEPQGEEIYLCEISVHGPRRTVVQQTWRRFKDRYVLMP